MYNNHFWSGEENLGDIYFSLIHLDLTFLVMSLNHSIRSGTKIYISKRRDFLTYLRRD